MINFFTRTFFGNSIQEWLIASVVLAFIIVLIKVFKRIVLSYLRKWSLKTETSLDDFFLETVEKSVIPLLYLGAFHVSLNTLTVTPKVESIVHVASLIYITFFILRIITAVVRKFVFSFIKSTENSETKEKQAKGLLIILNSVIWILGIIFIIDNLGYNVTTLITGLGIGGIAIALAAQTILGDLFSYFVIFFDKPFEIGDFIIVDNNSGTVEYVGIKTTRIRTLSGEQLICSNTYLTNAQVHNYKRMEQRRIVFNLGVTYQTETEKVKAIPEKVQEIIESKQEVVYDRGHFSGFGNFSLDFEFVYYVLSADYNVFMDKQQEIYFDILSRFEAEKIEFAYPTQTVFTIPEGQHSEYPNA